MKSFWSKSQMKKRRGTSCNVIEIDTGCGGRIRLWLQHRDETPGKLEIFVVGGEIATVSLHHTPATKSRRK